MPPVPVTTPVLMAFDGSHVWVAATLSVKKIRASDGQTVASYSLPQNAYGVVYDGYYVWVGISNGSGIHRIDPAGNVSSFPTAFGAMYGLGFDGNRVWAALGHSDKIAAFDGAGNLTLTVDMGAGSFPIGIAFDGTHIWAAAHNTNVVRKVDIVSGAVVATYPTQRPHQMAFDGVHMWIANDTQPGTVTKMRASDGAIVGVYGMGAHTQGVVFDGVNVWVANVLSDNVMRVRASDGAVLGTVPTCTYPFGLAFDGRNVWIGCHAGNSVIRR